MGSLFSGAALVVVLGCRCHGQLEQPQHAGKRRHHLSTEKMVWGAWRTVARPGGGAIEPRASSESQML